MVFSHLNTPNGFGSENLWTNDRQTETIRYLIRTELPVALDDLAARLATEDRGSPAGRASDSAIERVKVRLHHVDLPRLAAHGLCTYDHEQHLIRPVDDSEFRVV